MRTHFLILLLSLATLTAAAQTPVYNRFPPSTAQGAEILFNDGTTHHYSVVRIAKDVMRVRTTSDQSTRIPLSFINTVRFTDGGTFYFEDGKFLFDKLVQPAFLKSESGDVLLEGVLQLTKEQAATLMGPETYAEYRKNNRLLQAGVITLSAGTAMLVPYLGFSIAGLAGKENPGEVFKGMSPAWKGVTIGGGCALAAGIVMAIIGNSGCKRVVASYNNGLGLAYTF